ncbi:hypothetical protein BDV93DRAFT_528239 [Ceratobasidium sp. AG-I]|nr:hypothetical protein BDV93DRAFT_528239 [Ceratobasidium sp. AG-I]
MGADVSFLALSPAVFILSSRPPSNGVCVIEGGGRASGATATQRSTPSLSQRHATDKLEMLLTE